MVEPMRQLTDREKHHGCLGCQQCESGPVVTLRNGTIVCSVCPEWRIETEARDMNAMPIEARREQFRRIKEKRGGDAANALWTVMQELNKED